MRAMLFSAKSKPVQSEIPHRVDPSTRVYAVGDIHGRHDLLDTLFEKIIEDHFAIADERELKVVFLGDYIDRGDHTKDVLERMSLIRERLSERVIFLSGNHEAALLSFLEDPLAHKGWLAFGGKQTLGSYGISSHKSAEDEAALSALRDQFAEKIDPHLPFLRSLKRYAQSGDVVFVHAGLDPAVPLADQTDQALLWGESDFISSGGYPSFRVVHGHYDAPEPVVTPKRVCVDTGAYYSGRLTAIRLDDGEKLISVGALM